MAERENKNIKDIMTASEARKELYNIISHVNENHNEIYISNSKSKKDAVIISKEDWDSIQETLYLENVGVMDKVRERKSDDSGWTDITDINNLDEIDWDE